MKKLFILSLIGMFCIAGTIAPANAGFMEARRAKIEKNRSLNQQALEISRFFEKQTKLSNQKDYEALYKMYSPKYVNSDGFNKEIYFKLVKDTWESYKDIAYASKIRSIDIKGNYATVDMLEVAVATTSGMEEVIDAPGELTSLAKSTYFLEKIGDKWLITSEYIAQERTFLKFGEARYLDIDLIAPEIVNAGTDYTASLEADLPMDTVAVASIGREKIVYPENKSEDVFRKIPDSNVLERVFTANKDNINEYAIASMGITRAKAIDDENVKVYMSGLAFLMTRVNVIPINNFVKEEVEDDKKAE